MRPLLQIFSSIFFVCIALSQTTPISNQDVVELVKAGISEEVIIAKIKTSESMFATATPDLIRLKESGVSDRIILVMVERQQRSNPPESTGEAHAESTRPVGEIEREIAAHPDSKYFTVKYDRFKDATTVSVSIAILTSSRSFFPTREDFTWIILSRYGGTAITSRPRQRGICASSASRSWKFLKNRELTMLINAERLRMGPGSHDGDVRATYSGVDISEILCWELSDDHYRSLVSANQIEFQLGGFESIIPKHQLRLLHSYARMLDPTIKLTVDRVPSFSLVDAKGKRRVFVATSDKASEIEMVKEFRKRGFELTDTRESADIVVEFGVEQTDHFNFMNEAIERRWGRIIVYLRKDATEGTIFMKSKKPGFQGHLLHKQAGGLVEDFIEALRKVEKGS